jgi:hypothetical protein
MSGSGQYVIYAYESRVYIEKYEMHAKNANTRTL